VSLSTQTAWLRIRTAQTGWETWFRTRYPPYFGRGDWHCEGAALWTFELHAICQASPRSVGENICSSPWLFWELGSWCTVVGRCPSSTERWLALKRAMMTARWLHWVGLFCRRPSEFWIWLPKEYRYGYMVNWRLVPDRLRGQLAGAAEQSFIISLLNTSTWSFYHTGIRPPSSVSTVPVAACVY